MFVSMSAEQFTVPSVLELGFTPRVRAHLVEHNLSMVERAARHDEITPQLGALIIAETGISAGFENAQEKPWSSLMRITDAIKPDSVESEMLPLANPKALPVTKTRIGFESSKGQERFTYFLESVLAGIPSPDQPRIRPGIGEITVHGFAYADISAVGRLATTYMRAEYKDMGSLRRGFTKTSIEDIEADNMMPHLPTELLERIEEQREMLGTKSLLCTGRIGSIGLAMRNALVPADELSEAIANNTQRKLFRSRLQVQRPVGRRPHIEAGTAFLPDYGTSGDTVGIPISHNTMGRTLSGQVGARLTRYKDIIDRRDTPDAVENTFDLATGGAATLGVGTVFRAIWTIGRATGASLGGMISDRRLRKRLQAEYENRDES